MKLIKILAILLIATSSHAAQIKLQVVPEKSKIQFTASATKYDVKTTFKDFSGQIFYDTENEVNSAIDLTVVTSSLNSGNKSRDKHLLSKDFFDVESYPEASFKTTAILKIGGQYSLIGTLRVCGKNAISTFDLRATEEGVNPITNKRYMKFSAKTPDLLPLKRSSFGMVWNKPKYTPEGILFWSIKEEVSMEIELYGEEL